MLALNVKETGPRPPRHFSLNLEKQLELITSFPPGLPNLLTIRVNDVIEWRRLSPTARWRPRPWDREKLKAMLLLPPSVAFDVDRCLAGTFLPEELNERLRRQLGFA